jgi:hypothetical protein
LARLLLPHGVRGQPLPGLPHFAFVEIRREQDSLEFRAEIKNDNG